jgi:response regulator of citrate/malate metabolism
MNLPDIDGLELCRRIRAGGVDVDVIAITAVRSAEVVRASIAAGIVQYLIKPFTFGVFTDKLTSYCDFSPPVRAVADRGKSEGCRYGVPLAPVRATPGSW